MALIVGGAKIFGKKVSVWLKVLLVSVFGFGLSLICVPESGGVFGPSPANEAFEIVKGGIPESSDSEEQEEFDRKWENFNNSILQNSFEKVLYSNVISAITIALDVAIVKRNKNS